MSTISAVELHERIAGRAATVDWRRFFLLVLLALPYSIGWTVRLIVRATGWTVAYLWAACLEGYAAAAPKDT